MNYSKEYSQLYSEKLDLFKSLLSSDKFQPISPKKPEISTFFDSASSSFFIKSLKTLPFPKSQLLAFLFCGYQHHYLIDERQGKTFFLSELSPDLHLLYYFLRSPKEDLIENQEMLLLNGISIFDKEIFVIGFSVDPEAIPLKRTKQYQQMKSQINGYRIREVAEKTCEVLHILSRNYKNRLPNFVNFDWNQGGHLEKIERTLLFLNPDELSLKPPQSIEEIDEIIEKSLKEKGDKDPWISKYEELLKPSPEEFVNVDKVDLFNLYGEPYKPNLGKGRKLKESVTELPKNMAAKVKNNRTKEYLANLMTKTKK